MQEVSAMEFSEVAGKITEDFGFRLKVKEAEGKDEEVEEKIGSPDPDEEEEEEFSFSSAFGGRSPVAAEDVFEDGWIRPVFPLFNRELLLSSEEDGCRSPVKKLFYEEDEEEEGEAEGPYCEWDGKKPVVKEAAASECKKSNSTGFSKLWKLRELKMRSNSDGKDAFVFLNAGKDKNSEAGDNASESEKSKKKMVKKKGAEVPTTFSEHYATSRAKKEGNKKASYLPYRVGFFANVSGMSRNVHPF